MTSTLTAQFVPADDYLREYWGGQWNDPKYADYLRDEYQYAQGVVVMFGSAVVSHWLESSTYYRGFGRTDEDSKESEQECLDEIVAKFLAGILTVGAADVPMLELMNV